MLVEVVVSTLLTADGQLATFDPHVAKVVRLRDAIPQFYNAEDSQRDV